MDERDQSSTSGGGHELASEVGERVRTIISAAEAAANAVRHEAEQEAAVRRRVAEEEGARIIEDAKADADAYLAERIRRIAELSDTVVERAELIVSRLDRAEEVRQQLQSLADALGESAERLATEVRVGTPPPTVRTPSTPPGVAAPQPPPAAGDEQAGVVPAPPPSPSERQDVPEVSVVEEGSVVDEAPVVEDASVVDDTPVVDEAAADVIPPEPEAGAEVEDVEEAPAEGPEVVPLREDAPELDPEAATEAERHDADQQLGARLVALQMAVAGGARGEVEVHLRRTFDLADPSSILDDVFGQGTDAEKRVAWPRTGDGAA